MNTPYFPENEIVDADLLDQNGNVLSSGQADFATPDRPIIFRPFSDQNSAKVPELSKILKFGAYELQIESIENCKAVGNLNWHIKVKR